MLCTKSLGVTDFFHWNIEGAEKHYQYGFFLPKTRNLKRPFTEEVQIITTELTEYLYIG